MKTNKTKTTNTKASKDAVQGKAIEAKAALERTRLAAEAKVKALKTKIKVAGTNAKTELEKHIAELKGDNKKPQAKAKKTRKAASAA